MESFVFGIVLVLAVIIITNLFKLHKYTLKMKVLNEQLELDYPKINYKGKARKELIKILREFNEAFYKVYPNVREDNFNVVMDSYPKYHSNNSDITKQIQLYSIMNLEKKALKMIKKIIPVKLTIERQIEYFEQELLRSRKAKSLISSNDYHSFFPKLYGNRFRILMAIENNCLKIIEKLNAEKEVFEKALQDLAMYEKKGILERIGMFTWNMATAPIRHAYNIVDGLIENDPKRVKKSVGLLVLGSVGVGLVFDAIDGFEGLDGLGSDLAIDDSIIPLDSENGQHFVQPHTRILADGTEIWVDGDGDTSVNLTVENGGGYFRSNPKG